MVSKEMPRNVILILPKRRDHESDEEFQKRCSVILNIGEKE